MKAQYNASIDSTKSDIQSRQEETWSLHYFLSHIWRDNEQNSSQENGSWKTTLFC